MHSPRRSSSVPDADGLKRTAERGAFLPPLKCGRASEDFLHFFLVENFRTHITYTLATKVGGCSAEEIVRKRLPRFALRRFEATWWSSIF